MATEQRLIDANALSDKLKAHHDLFVNAWGGFSNLPVKDKARVDEITHCIAEVTNAPTVDAVPVDDMREFAEEVAYQFGYYCQHEGRLHITHGGLSVLEWAFEILEWDHLHPVPECECEIDGCHEHATCGAPTSDGYKRMCGRHYRERRTDNG